MLDDRRLGKQRVETLQILRALHLEGYGWAHHPAVLMWQGHTRALVAYGLAVIDEWVGRDHADTTAGSIAEFARPGAMPSADTLGRGEAPPWLGREDLHRSHRAALVRKDPAVYGPVFPDADPDLPYVWPDPPAAPRAVGRRSAWVLRPVPGGHLAVLARRGLVGVPASLGVPGDTPKRRRQRARWCDDVAPGDRVVVPVDDNLRCGTVTGAVAERRAGGQAHLVRPVAWDRVVARSALRRPYQLQDPQVVFAISDEPAVA